MQTLTFGAIINDAALRRPPESRDKPLQKIADAGNVEM